MTFRSFQKLKPKLSRGGRISAARKNVLNSPKKKPGNAMISAIGRSAPRLNPPPGGRGGGKPPRTMCRATSRGGTPAR